jgi:hypothetical protein
MRIGFAAIALSVVVLGAASVASAEPMFLSRQYARCATCHVNPAGGGLLTQYGRSLSHVELSTLSAPQPAHGEDEEAPPGEESFLFGALGDHLGPVQLGVHLRPSTLHVEFPGGSVNRNFLMAADLIGAVQTRGWTMYGSVGREPEDNGGKLASHEYWVGRFPESGFGFRVGRFLPAYGIRFADHTSYNRAYLGLTQYEQVLGLELSHTSGRYLTQVSLSPGRADSIIDDDGRRAFTATGRLQVDLAPTTALVLSGQYRDASDVDPKSGSAGGAFGFAPLDRLTVWTQVDGLFQAGASAPGVVLVNETSFEVFRGIWLKVTPQLRGGGGEETPDLLRLGLGADLLPRTHWNVNIYYYRDRDRTNRASVQTFLAQLHMYL